MQNKIYEWKEICEKYNVYHSLDNHFSRVDIVIHPRNNATDEKHHHWMRNRNLREIKCYGRMKWQSDRDYGKRNQAERAK